MLKKFTTALFLLILIISSTGCPPPTADDTPPPSPTVRIPDPLTMLVIDDATIGDVIARQWSARREGTLTIINQTTAELAEKEFQWPREVDVILYPPVLIGELESRDRLLPLPRDVWKSEEINKAELLPLFRSTLVNHSNEVWGVPLGQPQFALMYNRELFQQQKWKLPTEWSDLVAIATAGQKLATATDMKSNGMSGIDLPLAEGWAAQTFLARAAPAIRSRGMLSFVFDRKTMQPLITKTPFLEALADLKTMLGDDHTSLKLTPEKVFQRVLSGKSTAGVTWPSLHFQLTDTVNEKTSDAEPVDKETSVAVGFAQLPGLKQWYDFKADKWSLRGADEPTQVDLIGIAGVMGSVSANSRNTETGFDFLVWLASKSINLETMVQSPNSGPFRFSHLGDPTRWTGELISDEAATEYSAVVQAVHDEQVVLLFPRIPGHDRYLKSLDHHVRDCLANDLDPAISLAAAAKEWEAITNELIREKQINELRNDAGL